MAEGPGGCGEPRPHPPAQHLLQLRQALGEQIRRPWRHHLLREERHQQVRGAQAALRGLERAGELRGEDGRQELEEVAGAVPGEHRGDGGGAALLPGSISSGGMGLEQPLRTRILVPHSLPTTTCPWSACTATARTWRRPPRSPTRAATRPPATTLPGSTRTWTTCSRPYTSSPRRRRTPMPSGKPSLRCKLG